MIYTPLPIDGVVNRASIHQSDFSDRTDNRGQKIRIDLYSYEVVFCDSLVENGTPFSFRFARAETAKRNERLESLNVVFSEKEGRWCLAAFYLSLSSRHLTDRIQLMIRREKMYAQERNIFSQ